MLSALPPLPQEGAQCPNVARWKSAPNIPITLWIAAKNSVPHYLPAARLRQDEGEMKWKQSWCGNSRAWHNCKQCVEGGLQWSSNKCNNANKNMTRNQENWNRLKKMNETCSFLCMEETWLLHFIDNHWKCVTETTLQKANGMQWENLNMCHCAGLASASLWKITTGLCGLAQSVFLVQQVWSRSLGPASSACCSPCWLWKTKNADRS